MSTNKAIILTRTYTHETLPAIWKAIIFIAYNGDERVIPEMPIDSDMLPVIDDSCAYIQFLESQTVDSSYSIPSEHNTDTFTILITTGSSEHRDVFSVRSYAQLMQIIESDLGEQGYTLHKKDIMIKEIY